MSTTNPQTEILYICEGHVLKVSEPIDDDHPPETFPRTLTPIRDGWKIVYFRDVDGDNRPHWYCPECAARHEKAQEYWKERGVVL